MCAKVEAHSAGALSASCIAKHITSDDDDELSCSLTHEAHARKMNNISSDELADRKLSSRKVIEILLLRNRLLENDKRACVCARDNSDIAQRVCMLRNAVAYLFAPVH